MSTTVTVLIVYLAVLAALAIWSRRETHTLSGYYLAGKKLPYWVVAFSTNATGESGWLLLGLSGMGYLVGMQAYWVVVGELLGIGASWWIIARRLKKMGDETDAITVPDVLAAKFQDKWHLIRGIAVVITDTTGHCEYVSDLGAAALEVRTTGFGRCGDGNAPVIEPSPPFRFFRA